MAQLEIMQALAAKAAQTGKREFFFPYKIGVIVENHYNKKIVFSNLCSQLTKLYKFGYLEIHMNNRLRQSFRIKKKYVKLFDKKTK